MQVARITNVPDWYFERVVFPGQRLLFESVPSALLEIHTGMMASAILSDTIPCERLAMDELGASQISTQATAVQIEGKMADSPGAADDCAPLTTGAAIK